MIGTTGANYTLIMHDEFETFNQNDGITGVWSTENRRGNLVTNGPNSVFVDGTQGTSDGGTIDIDPISVSEGILEIGAGVIPESELGDVQQFLNETGQGQYADDIEYYTGKISTHQTWGQTYGYFEIVAQVPAGKGHWSAFWLAPIDDGWPPEIDIFEAYGRGVHGNTPKDDTFNTAVFFDNYDVDGNDTLSMDITNPYDLDGNGNPTEPDWRIKGGEEIGVFHKIVDASDYGWDIYNNFFTYAAEWTPDEIIFYFGPSRDSLIEVFRTPTPDDLHSPMKVIANDQISSHWGWQPVDGHDDLTFADDNTLKIDSISIYAMTPGEVIAGAGDGAVIVDGADGRTIEGTLGDDTITPGDGLDFIHLKGGADTVVMTRGVGNNVVDGFGADDTLVFEGFYFDGAEGAAERLTQVGDDVWLSSGAYPINPQTVIFRDTTVDALSADNFDVRWSVTPDVWANRQIDGTRLKDDDGDGIITAEDHGSRITGFRGETLIGSAAGDKYFVYGTDTVIEEAHRGGVDTATTFVNYVLPDHVENIFAGRVGVEVTGNDLGNVLAGRDANTLTGGLGDDLYDLTEGSGHTIGFAAGDGDDHVLGFASGDSVRLDGIGFEGDAHFSSHIRMEDGATVLDLGAAGSLTFRGTDAATVAEAFGYELAFDERARLGNDEDSIATGAGSDTVFGRGGDDVVSAGSGDDTVRGGNGADTVDGGDGDDRLNGGDGDDVLIGGNGDDVVTGSTGDDTLIGGEGRDILNGGAGADQLHFTAGDGRNIINGFDETDLIVLDGIALEDAGQNGRHTTLTLSGDVELVLRDFAVADLHEDMFAIV